MIASESRGWTSPIQQLGARLVSGDALDRETARVVWLIANNLWEWTSFKWKKASKKKKKFSKVWNGKS